MIKVVREWEGLITINEKDLKRTDIYFSEAEEVKEVKKVAEVKIDTKDLRTKLKENGIKFFPWAKEDKIIELAKENNII